MQNTTHVLINLLAIMFNILFLQSTLYKRNQERIQIEKAVFVMIFVMVAVNNLFPIELSGGFIFNLSMIPLAFGCFYAMKYAGVWFFIMFAYLASRFIQGVPYSGISVSLVLLFSLVFLYFRRRFNAYTMEERLRFLALIMLIMSSWWLIELYFFYHVTYSVLFCFAYLSIQSIGIYLLGYMLESVRRQQTLVGKVIKMEKMEVVSHLAASISHEVRNPLTAAKGFMQLLGERDDLPEDQRAYLDIALQEINQAESIIRNYLTFAKPAQENVEELELKIEIEKALQIIASYANMNDVQLKSEIHPALLTGNRGLFQQVLINLLKNGIEAMPSGGVLSLTTYQNDSEIEISIKDEGIGMTEEQKSRLGEPYFTTKEAKGTGLGMMVVYRIVESMNGKIQIVSMPGKGTSVTLLFPTK